ncbi:AMP-dependent synthetase and ligase [Chthoniobacter flavus Ellin428]|uniref:AMP-dependent synthetase and ligase n=1 Tax=Chthoniobacter flavus Ellin428 TaxID=497964 RepID=B4CXM7_9BACT|nr:class I adenylate-forming enzyme family protein [Chthoniobacter flavus]EDY21025.1 AMP-dependent synthetase and ligase [Chthoniobacter flavus Ellin428]TCO88750.1 acyl-CoA synthetase (AMP-forming)/AMP-acid ligase II [Chthoniobacter flavus]
MKTLALLLRAASADAGSAVALLSDRHRLSYADTWRQVEQLGCELQAAGLTPGKRVIAITSLTVETVLMLVAISWTGAIIIPAVASGPGADLNGVRQFSPCHLIGTAEHLEPFDVELCAEFRVGEKRYFLGRWEDDQDGDAPTRDETIFLTSGTTDGPLGVVCSQAQIAFCQAAIQQRLRYVPQDRVLIGGPLSFDYHYYQLLLAFAARATLVVCDQVQNPLAMADRILRMKVTVLPLIPYSFRLLLKSRMLERGDYSCVRLLSATGEVWPKREIELLAQAFPAASVFPMYGLTECKRVSILDQRLNPELLGAVGFPLTGTRVQIFDPNHSALSTGDVGEIAVEGPHLADGYFQRPEATCRRFHQHPDGRRFLLTGDQGYLDERGALWFVGRDTQLIKYRGIRTSAAAIETAFLQCPNVQRAVAMNVLTRSGEKVAVMIELADQSAAGDTKIAETVRSLWPLHGQPDYFEFGFIPLLANGKPARAKVATLLHERCTRIE